MTSVPGAIRRSAVAGACLLVTALPLACSSNGRTSGTVPKSAVKPTSTATATTHPDMSATCSGLADSRSLLTLGTAIPGLFVGDGTSRTTAIAAAASLKRLSHGAPDSLRTRMVRAETALDAVTSTVPNARVGHELAVAFESLGQEVQAECRLSLK